MMKKFFLLILSCVFCFTLGYAFSDNSLYYYSLGKQCRLSIIQNKLAVKKNSNIDRNVFLNSLSLRPEACNIEWRGSDICIIEFRDTIEINQFKSDILLRDLHNIITWPVYTIGQHTEAILYPEILIKPKSSCNIDSVVARHGLAIKSDREHYLIYSVPQDSDAIFIANQIYESGTCEFSYPHFGVRFQLFSHIPNDTYFPYQITCHNTGQTLPNGHSGTIDADIDAPEAWDITKGSPNVVVAVFDSGVTSDHPDLPNSRQIRLNGSNFGSGNSNDPSPTGNDNHGNACAGVIAASMDNNEGIAGIAPYCRIMPLRWDGSSSDDRMADGIYFAINNGANVISCSWGVNDPYYTSDVLYAAIQTAIAQNVIVIFAAGNTANQAIGDNGFVTFPANANIANLITVGASDRYDRKAYYSPSSQLIDFVAPSHRAYSSQLNSETFEMYTIDIPGYSGYNPTPSGMDNNIVPGTTLPSTGTNYLAYTGFFGGTSHSCPVVAGVVALILSINPYLTPAAVFDILKQTSDKVGGYLYIVDRCKEMGYGRVNAYAAVKKALRRYPIQGPDYVCDTAKYYLKHPLQQGETVSWSVHNGVVVSPSYSIIGATNQDTVTVVKTTMGTVIRNENTIDLENILPPFPSDTIQKLKAIINGGNNSDTIIKIFRKPINGDVPTITASNNAVIWTSGTSRTFSITNCTSVPDSLLQWEIKTEIYNYLGGTPTISYSYATGRTLTYTPVIPPLKICRIYITAINSKKECPPNSTTLSYMVNRKKSLSTMVDDDILNINISEDITDATPRLQSPKHVSGEFTLELWHAVYGRLRVKKVSNTHEQIDIRDLPKGVYVLILKDDTNIIAEEKTLIF